MKTCPVCTAVAFDDAEICFGCMHRFEKEDAQSPRKPQEEIVIPLGIPAIAPELRANHAAAPSPVSVGESPSFSIKLTPDLNQAGKVKWSCAVEMVPALA